MDEVMASFHGFHNNIMERAVILPTGFQITKEGFGKNKNESENLLLLLWFVPTTHALDNDL